MKRFSYAAAKARFTLKRPEMGNSNSPIKTLNDLYKITVALENVSEKVVDEKVVHEIRNLKEKLVTGKFYLVAVGLFKRGKSSLINALLNKPLAPVALTPLTAIVTLFEYNESPYVEVFYKNGKSRREQLKNIPLYVTEDKNPENMKQVSHVIIYDNNPLLKNCTLVDTPGIGSVLDHNTQTIYEFLPKIDAALFVLSADLPMSKEDASFLQELKKTVSTIIFVLNKSDLLSEGEIDIMLRYNANIVSSVSGFANDDVQIIPVSSRHHAVNNSSSNIDLLRGSILDLVFHDKETIVFQMGKNRLQSLITQVHTLAKLRLETVQMPVHQLEEKNKSLQKSMELMLTNKKEFDILIEGQVKQLQDRIAEEVKKTSAIMRSRIVEQLHQDGNEIIDALQRKGTPAVQATWSNQIIQSFNELKTKLETETKISFHGLLKNYSRESRSFLNELSMQLESLKGIDFDRIIETFDLNIYTSFYFHTQCDMKVPYIKGRVLYKLMPAQWAEKKVLRRMERNMQEIITMNSAGIVYDLQYKIQESFRMFRYDLHEKLITLVQSIENIITETIHSKVQTESNLDHEVSRIKEKLRIIEGLMP